jgi:hypothetical protein
MCRQTLRNDVPEAGKPALSCLPNRACKVNSLLRFFAISLNKQHSLSRCFDCEQRSPSARSRLALSRRGPCVPSRSAPGLSHALHQVRKQGCPSSPALSSPEGGSRQEIADIPRFAAPPGDAHRARGSLILAPFQHAGCSASANLSCSCSSYCAGFNRSRRVILAPRPTWKSVSLSYIRCRILASLCSTIAHNVLDPFGDPQTPRPQCRTIPDPQQQACGRLAQRLPNQLRPVC